MSITGDSDISTHSTVSATARIDRTRTCSGGIYLNNFVYLKIKQPSRVNLNDASSEEYEAWVRSRQAQRPDDQLDLTEAELSEEITKVLQTDNTNFPKNLVIYSFKDSGYVDVYV